jgi:hypothetical protein
VISNQCCGSGIRCLFNPWIRDGGKNQDPDPGGMNNPDHISESLEIIFWGLKYLKIFLKRIRDGKNSDPG